MAKSGNWKRARMSKASKSKSKKSRASTSKSSETSKTSRSEALEIPEAREATEVPEVPEEPQEPQEPEQAEELEEPDESNASITSEPSKVLSEEPQEEMELEDWEISNASTRSKAPQASKAAQTSKPSKSWITSETMEPLTALILTSNIFQFIEFGKELLGDARGMYQVYGVHYPNGSLIIHEKVEFILIDLEVLHTKLRGAFAAYSTTSNFPSPQQHWTALQKVIDEVAEVVEDFMGRLKRLRLVRKTKRIYSLRHEIRGLWNEEEVAGLMVRFSLLRGSLESNVIPCIRGILDAVPLQSLPSFDSIDVPTQKILTSLLQNMDGSMSPEVREGGMAPRTVFTIAHLLRRIDHTEQNNQRQKSREVIMQMYTHRTRNHFYEGDPIVGIEMLDVQDEVEQMVRSSILAHIKKSLEYPSMDCPYDEVVEAHPEAFGWVFEGPTEEQMPWSDLPNWLEAEGGIYWVYGEDGSGKSTFLKHISEDQRTWKRLTTWAGEHKLCVLAFYFRNCGSKVEISKVELLRSLLSQIFKQCPELVLHVLPRIWAALYDMMAIRYDLERLKKVDIIWTCPILIAALEALIRQTIIPLKMCIFVDGLDESGGDHEDIGKFFLDITMADNVKACVSSRHQVFFEALFRGSRMLWLQQLIEGDTKKYVVNELQTNAACQELIVRQPEAAHDLSNEIVQKSEGVFLWAELTTRSLLASIQPDDEITALRKGLSSFPPGPGSLYNHMLESVDSTSLPWVAKAFQLLRANRNCIDSIHGHSTLGVLPLTLAIFYFAMNEDAGLPNLQSIGVEGYDKSQSEMAIEPESTEAHRLPFLFLTVRHSNWNESNKTWNILRFIEKGLRIKCRDALAQIGNRCGGFLTVSLEKVEDEDKLSKCYHPYPKYPIPDSSIQYCHRTAREFIENEEIWSNLVLQTDNADFCPNNALMRASIIRFQLSLPKRCSGLEIGEEREYHLDLLTDIMIYARNADTHHPSRAARIALLSQVKEMLVSRHESQYEPGYETSWAARLGFRYSKTVDNFLELTSVFGIQSYVHEEISKLEESGEESQSQKVATSLLYSLVSIQGYTYPRTVPLPTVAMVRLLIYLGADVNSSTRKKSPWKMLLDFEGSTKVSMEPLRKRNIEIMTVLVSCGAELTVRVDGKLANGEKSYCVVDFVENILLPVFPVEATPLLAAVREKLKSKLRRGLNEVLDDTEKEGPRSKEDLAVNFEKLRVE